MTLYLVRHASALGRSRWSLDDMERPLDHRGTRQSEAITRYLADRPIRAIWSSQARRCTETVAGIAAALDLPVVVHRELTEGARPAATLALLRPEAAHDDDLVACSHGDVIPEVLNRLLRNGMVVRGQRGCEKGSIWEIECEGDRIARGRYIARP